MSTSFDDAVRDIISKGGAPAQAGTPDQLTEQVNQSAAAPAPAAAPAGAPQQEPAQNVAIDQNAVQPTSGDDDTDELARINAGARAEQAQADAATPGEPGATAEPVAGEAGAQAEGGADQAAGEQPGGDASETGGDNAGGEGGAQAEGTPGADGADAGTGSGADEAGGGKDDAGADDGFDVDADDDGVEPDPDDESDLDEEPEQDDDEEPTNDEGGSQDGEDAQSPEGGEGAGEGEGGQDDQGQTGEQADTGTGGEESPPDNGAVDNFQDPGADPAPEGGEGAAEDSDPENAADDAETTASEQAQAEVAEQADNPAEKAAAVIKEAREMSDRLGELAEQIVDRHVTPQGEQGQQAPGATIPAGEEPATQEDLEQSIAVESRRAHQFARNMLMQEARTRLGFAIESEASGTVYHQANVRMLEGAIGSLENLARNNISSKLHLDTKIEAIEERVNAMTEVQTVTIDTRVISDLHVQGSLSLDTLIYAPVYQRAVGELREWLSAILGAYLKSAQTGARAIVMPFSSGVLVDNAKIAQVLRESLPVCSDSVSRVLPGNRVMAYVKQDDVQKVMKVVRLAGQEPPAQVTLTGTSTGSVKQAVNELKLLARAQQDSIRNIVALTNASKSILGWVNQATDDDLINLDLPALLPMAYTPAISLHTSITAYIWALVGLLEAIVAKAKGTEGGA